MVHKLDDLYEKWWRSDGVGKDEHDAVMLATLRYARRATGDDDAASDAVLYIVSNFERFYRKTPDSYSRWVSSICRKRRQNRLHRKLMNVPVTFPSMCMPATSRTLTQKNRAIPALILTDWNRGSRTLLM